LKIRRVSDVRCQVGEGPLWDEKTGRLYFVDLVGQRLWRLDIRTETFEKWDVPQPLAALALTVSGEVVVTLADGFYAADLASGQVRLLSRLELPANTQFNDGKVDRSGRFIAVSMNRTLRDATAGIFRLGVTVEQLAANFTLGNGPCWSLDGRTFYCADSVAKAIYAYDYGADDGALANRRLFASTAGFGGIPDGATIDSEGNLWMAICDAGKVVCFTPSGAVARAIDMPTRWVTSVMFGGEHLDQLYVTSLDPTVLGKPSEEAAGYLYVIEDFGARGVAEPRLAEIQSQVTSGLIGALADLAYYFAPSVRAFQAARIVEGVALVGIFSAGPALLMSTTSGRRRTVAMTFWSTYTPTGFSLGLLLAGAFAGTAVWRGVFAVHGLLMVAAALVALKLPAVPLVTSSASIAARLLDLGDAYRQWPVVKLAAVFFLIISVGFGTNTIFPSFLARAHDISMPEASRLVAAATLMMIAGAFLVANLLNRGILPRVVMLILGAGAIVCGAALFWPSTPLGATAPLLAVWFLFMGGGPALLLAILPLVAAPQRRGAAAGLFNQASAIRHIYQSAAVDRIVRDGRLDAVCGTGGGRMAGGFGVGVDIALKCQGTGTGLNTGGMRHIIVREGDG
jgi:sugar lactone lactonase YvrE/predicted MFS family arabinose efflux permease